VVPEPRMTKKFWVKLPIYQLLMGMEFPTMKKTFLNQSNSPGEGAYSPSSALFNSVYVSREGQALLN